MGFSAHLIVNPASGGAAALRGRLTEAARERGIRVRVLEPGQDARFSALAAVGEGAEALAVAGGDGSVAAVAAVAVECELPLVSVPAGTLNHFARDLGLELTCPLSALDAFYAGHEERRVDVGRQPLDVLIAGDDEGAKETVTQLVHDGGLRAIDVGPLERARELEGLGFLGITLQQPLGLNFQSAWKLIS